MDKQIFGVIFLCFFGICLDASQLPSDKEERPGIRVVLARRLLDDELSVASGVHIDDAHTSTVVGNLVKDRERFAQKAFVNADLARKYAANNKELAAEVARLRKAAAYDQGTLRHAKRLQQETDDLVRTLRFELLVAQSRIKKLEGAVAGVSGVHPLIAQVCDETFVAVKKFDDTCDRDLKSQGKKTDLLRDPDYYVDDV